MKKKFTAAAAITLAAAMMLTGCSESILTSGSNSDASSVESIWTANDEDIVAWATGETLSDEEKEYYNIKFKDFFPEYLFNITSNGIDETNSAYTAYAEYYRQNVINTLTTEKIILKKAEEMGLSELTEEEMAEIEEKYLQNLDGWYARYEEQAKTELGISDSDTESGSDDTATQSQIVEKEKELFREYITQFGLSEDIFLTWQTNTFIMTKVYDEISKDINVTDEQVQAFIDDTIAEAKAAYEKSAAEYESNSSYQSVWLPEGSREIKYIFLSLNSSDIAEISAARTESGADDAEIDAMRDEKLAEIKDKADSAYEKATADGADFDAVVKEYSNDYTEDTEGATLTVFKNSSINEKLYDAIFALEKPGDISPLVATDRGYYIIQYVADSEITDEDMKTVFEATKNQITTSLKNEKITNALSEWEKEVAYELDYDKLNFTKPEEETSSDESAESENSAESEQTETSTESEE